MDIPAVMAELAARIKATISSLPEVYGRPELKPEVPAFIIGLPVVDYDQTAGRGSDDLEGSFVIIVGPVSEQESSDRLIRHANGSGPHSVKAAVEAPPHTAFDTIQVYHAEPDRLTFGGIDYTALILDYRISGPGSV